MSVVAAFEKGLTTFMGLEFLVGPGALVPRPETEQLAHAALEALASRDASSLRVIDLCCGVGNLACAVASHEPRAYVWATDLTDGAVDLTRRNVAHRNLGSKVSVHQGDLLADLRGRSLEGTIDVVVCNPPYISEKRLTEDRAHLLEHEPREAFAAGPYGIAIHQRAVKEALDFLKPGGELLFEIGVGQERQVEMLFDRTKSYEPVRRKTNADGEVRVLLARKRSA